MQHWDRKAYRKRVASRVALMLVAVSSVAVISGKSRSKDLGKAPRLQEAASMRIDARELSGIRVARDEVRGGIRVAAVGDHSAILFDVTVSEELQVEEQGVIEFSQGIDERFAICGTATGANCRDSLSMIRSQWEALAVDGVGQNYLLQEYSRAIVVMDPSLQKVKHTINFDFSSSAYAPKRRSQRYRKFDDNLSAEGFLLMKNGHILVAKEKAPAILAEFAPTGSAAVGVNRETLLGSSEAFDLPDGSDRSALTMVAEWKIVGYGKCDISDLTSDEDGAVYVLSETCGTIQKLENLVPGQPDLVPQMSWRLPKHVKHPEGLAIDHERRFWITSDLKDKGNNIHVLTIPAS